MFPAPFAVGRYWYYHLHYLRVYFRTTGGLVVACLTWLFFLPATIMQLGLPDCRAWTTSIQWMITWTALPTITTMPAAITVFTFILPPHCLQETLQWTTTYLSSLLPFLLPLCSRLPTTIATLSDHTIIAPPFCALTTVDYCLTCNFLLYLFLPPPLDYSIPVLPFAFFTCSFVLGCALPLLPITAASTGLLLPVVERVSNTTTLTVTRH